MYLLRTIRSTVKPAVIYGNAGDEVSVVAWHDDVAIVAAKNGSRFSVHKRDLVIEAGQSAPDTADIINRASVSKRRSVRRQEMPTNSLFE
jgi:hypothetical protein